MLLTLGALSTFWGTIFVCYRRFSPEQRFAQQVPAGVRPPSKARSDTSADEPIDELDSNEDGGPVDISVMFTAAQHAVRSLKAVPEEQHLLALYAHYKQALLGPCSTAQPSSFDMVARAKWDAWSALGDMDSEMAKEEYCKLADRLKPGWRKGLQPTPSQSPASSPPVRSSSGLGAAGRTLDLAGSKMPKFPPPSSEAMKGNAADQAPASSWGLRCACRRRDVPPATSASTFGVARPRLSFLRG